MRFFACHEKSLPGAGSTQTGRRGRSCLQGSAECACFPQGGMPGHRARLKDAPGQHLSAVTPVEEAEQSMVIVQHRFPVLRAVAFRRHEEHAVLARIGIAGSAFGHGKQTVKGGLELAGKAPVVHGRGQHDNVRRRIGRIDGRHVVLLHAGMCGILAALHAAETAANVHPLQIEAGNDVSGLGSAFREGVTEHGRIAVETRTAVQDDDVLAHDLSPLEHTQFDTLRIYAIRLVFRSKTQFFRLVLAAGALSSLRVQSFPAVKRFQRKNGGAAASWKVADEEGESPPYRA